MLSMLEALRYLKVGSYLKDPTYPVWLIQSGSHYTVLYASDRDANIRSPSRLIYEKIERMFFQQAGEAGYLSVHQAQLLLASQGVCLKALADVFQDDLVLFPDLWARTGYMLELSASELAVFNASVEYSAHEFVCEVCTLLNASSNLVCAACESPAPGIAQTHPPSLPSASLLNAKVHAKGATFLNSHSFEVIHLNGLADSVRTFDITTMSSLDVGGGYVQTSSALLDTLRTKWKGCLVSVDEMKLPSIE